MTVETISLRKIAYARSGDKGSTANIGVIAYTKEGYDFLREYLDENKVAKYFNSLGPERVERYLLDNLGAINFLLIGALAGGGSQSLRIDSQGKALGMAMLEMPIQIEEKLLEVCKKTKKEEIPL
jgi:hypothetical protein